MSNKCRLIIFSDIHYLDKRPEKLDFNLSRKLTQYSVEVIDKLINKINEDKPDVSICLGDLIEDTFNHDLDIINYTYIWNKLKNIQVPFYSVMGNHDLRTMNSRKELEKIMGYQNATFSFNLKGYHFIQRNRIIAGLALGVFVPEASEKSGSLSTVNFAIENGRQIFALPGQVNSSKSMGTNRLIRSLQACCVLEPNHIIEQFPQFKKQRQEKQKAVQLDLNEQMVLSFLENEEMHYEKILEKSQMDSKSLNSLLTRMEIRGLIVRLAGNSFARKV